MDCTRVDTEAAALIFLSTVDYEEKTIT